MTHIKNDDGTFVDNRISMDGSVNSYEFTPYDGEHFMFFAMNVWQLDYNNYPYHPQDIEWLSRKLEQYKDERCYIFTHLFFPSKSGNLNCLYPSGNWVGGQQYSQLVTLLNKYPRVHWFSGHSHWKWYLQEMSDRANIYPTSNVGRKGGWCVHVPSCAYPQDTNNGTDRFYQDLESEGAIVSVYEDYIDIQGITFKTNDTQEYTNLYVPIAQYRLYTNPAHSDTPLPNLIHKQDILRHTEKSMPLAINETTVGGDTYISVMFSNASSGVLICPKGLRKTYVAWECDDLQVTNNNGEDITMYLRGFANAFNNGQIPCGIYQDRSSARYTIYPCGNLKEHAVYDKTETGQYGI